MTPEEMTDEAYQALSEFRYQIRRFLLFSEQAAKAAGLVPQHHQVLLAIKGLPDGRRPTIGELAERLQLKHHSVVELVDRACQAGLVVRRPGESDRREVLVHLTDHGERLLQELSLHHRAELRAAAPALVRTLSVVLGASVSPPNPAVDP